MNVIELRQVLIIAKRWDVLIQKIRQCHSKHTLMKNVLQDTANVILYADMIVELEKEINNLIVQLSIDLISDDTTLFERQREEFFSNLMKLISTLRQINSKLKDLLPFRLDIEKLEEELKKKVTRLGDQLLTIASKTDLSQQDSDKFRSRLIAEHACLAGEDWRRRREKMQKQDDIEYMLKELDGDDIATEVLRTCYHTFRQTYDGLISQHLDSLDKMSDAEPNLDILISEIKVLVGTVVQKHCNTVRWNHSFKKNIPVLLAHIFALWTLKNTQHYNAMRGIEAARAYLLMPHVGQVIAIFRILGIGYNEHDDLMNNLVQIGTGEGKSVVMAVTACVFALIGVDVNCSCYSEALNMSAYKACATRFSNWIFLIDEAVQDMLTALKSFQSSTYIVQNDRIVYVEGESIVDNVVHGYNTVWAYYHEHEKDNISQLLAHGGIHVLQTFFSEELSEEYQIMGRGARQGDRGSYRMILENEILQASAWETKANNLRAFMNTIGPKGGMGAEAIEIGLWHAVKESEMPDSISQVILIGDAPANTESEVRQKRARFGEAYWEKTRFGKPTYYTHELQKLKSKNIPVHAFYLTRHAKDNFKQIANETRGRCERLNIHSLEGAESLTDFVTEEVLRKAAGDQGDAAVELYRKTYKTFTF
ncbi:unnamed protein product [Rotaria sordida]|uniref:Uncharacterized protein n=1 Tax=Rotaria sordida TaxID=392033 RepID=A0A819G767_9BILA|nr:unnamed protein product [Rotaria sordida]